MDTNQTLERRYDIDWLRVLTIGLLLIYHIAIVLQPWGIYIGFIQNTESLEWLWIPMTMLNVWRIPLLFFVSGMGLSFALRKRNIKKLLLERSRRILIPFVFGVLCVVPIHVIIWENYYEQEINVLFNPAHLWFLGNIFIYVLLLIPLIHHLQKAKGWLIVGAMKRVFNSAFGLCLMMIFFVIEALLLAPEQFELYAMTWHGFILGFITFFFGFSFINSGIQFSVLVQKWRWLFLIGGVLLYGIRLLYFELKAPNYLIAIESVIWIFTMFGFAAIYLNKPNRILNYLSQSAYPVYIIHMVFLYLGSVLILPLNLPVVLKFVLLVLFTFAGCMLCYEFLIRRVKFLRPIFGLNWQKSLSEKKR